jgi:hypothetical protein
MESNTRQDFEEWKNWWYKTVPRCNDFICIHELTSCGVDYICGDSTRYEMWLQWRDLLCGKCICTDVGCEDCILKYDCKERLIK